MNDNLGVGGQKLSLVEKDCFQERYMLGCTLRACKSWSLPAARLKKEPRGSNRDTNGLMDGGSHMPQLPWWLRQWRIHLQCRRPWFNSWVRKFPWRRDGLPTLVLLGFPGGSAGKESTCSAADPSSIPGSGKSPWRRDRLPAPVFLGFPDGSVDKESPCNAGDQSSIIGLGRSPGGGHGNPLQYSCPENPHGQRSLADYSPWGYKELDTTERLSTF